MALRRFMVHIDHIGIPLGASIWPQVYGSFGPAGQEPL